MIFFFIFLHHISYEELKRDLTLNDDMFYEPILNIQKIFINQNQ